MNRKQKPDEIFLPKEEVKIGAGWVDDPDDEFQWFRIYPEPRLPGDHYFGLEIVMSLSTEYFGDTDEVRGYSRPEFYIERDPRQHAVNGGDRYDYGCVPIPVHDKEHALAILATPSGGVVTLLAPALEWARVVPTTLENLSNCSPGEERRIKRLFGEETTCPAT